MTRTVEYFRMGRSTVGYSGGSRSSMSAPDSHGLYSSRQGVSYSGGMSLYLITVSNVKLNVSCRSSLSLWLVLSISCFTGSYSGSDVYSSSYGSEYASRGSDVRF